MNSEVTNKQHIHAQQTSVLWTKQFITLTLASFLLFLNLQMLLSSFSMHIKSNLYGGDMHVSLATSAFAMTAIVARLLTAKWIKRWSRNTVLTAGLIIAALSTILAAIPDTVGPLLFMRCLYGIGFGIGSTIIPTLVSQIIPPKRMGEGIGYFGLSTSLAMSIGPATGMSIMKNSGFTMLAVFGTGAVLCAFPMLFLAGVFTKKKQLHHKEAVVSNNSVNEDHRLNHESNLEKEHQKQDKVWVFPVYFPALMNVLVSITYSGILSFIAVYGEELQLANVGLFFLFNALTILLIRPIAGKLFDKKGPYLVLFPAAFFIIASMLVLSYTTTMGMLIISAMLYGVGFGSIQPTLQAWMLRSVQPSKYGMVNGIFYNATDVGVSVGALLLGVIATLTAYDTMYRLSSVCMIIFLVAIFYSSKKTVVKTKAVS